MAVIADCPSCVVGNHAEHVTQWGFRAEGVIDGEFCHCAGDCRERSAANMAIWFPPLGTELDPAPDSAPETVTKPADEHTLDADSLIRDLRALADSWVKHSNEVSKFIDEEHANDLRAVLDKHAPVSDHAPKDHQ